MKRYTIHFWDKNIEAKIVDEESAATILKAKSEGGMFEFSGAFYEGSSVWAIVPLKKDQPVFQIEAPKGAPVTKDVIKKVTEDLKKRGLLHSADKKNSKDLD